MAYENIHIKIKSIFSMTNKNFLEKNQVTLFKKSSELFISMILIAISMIQQKNSYQNDRQNVHFHRLLIFPSQNASIWRNFRKSPTHHPIKSLKKVYQIYLHPSCKYRKWSSHFTQRYLCKSGMSVV